MQMSLFPYLKKSEKPEYKHLPSFVREEKDTENVKLIFNEFIHLYKKEIKLLKGELNELKKKKAQEDQLKLFNDELLNKFKKIVFGKSSEKRKLSSRSRKKLKKKILLESESLVPAPKEEEMKDLEEIKVDHKLTDEELSDIAQQYGYPKDSEWEELKIQDVSGELDVHVRSYVRKKHCLNFPQKSRQFFGEDHSR